MAELSDVGAERAVLAGLLRYGIDAYLEVADIIDHSTFRNSNNQILYKCVERVLSDGSQVDLPSILSAASQLNFSESVNSKQELRYIKSLFDFPVSKENVHRLPSKLKSLRWEGRSSL